MSDLTLAINIRQLSRRPHLKQFRSVRVKLAIVVILFYVLEFYSINYAATFLIIGIISAIIAG